MKNIKTTMIAASALLLAAISLPAAGIQFTAQTANNIAGVSEAALPAAGLVEVGTWDGATFSVLGSGPNDNAGFVGPGDGFFNNSVAKFDTNSIAGAQLAFRWSDGVNVGIAYFDITAGGDAGVTAQWTAKAGDGGGTDFNVNIMDLSDLTNRTDYSALDGPAVLIGAAFGGTNLGGVPSFNLVPVPEPSAFAALAGVMALGFVALRRRRA
ncbi:MAG: PEP-CTERM sorting domain-containing protein [Opitutaceae bacterium]